MKNQGFRTVWGGDQAFSIKLARMDFAGMIGVTAADVHPPLYYIILMIANRVLGDYGWVYHLVSIIPLGITLVVIVKVIYNEFGVLASLLIITFVTLMNSSLVENNNARMYSWAALFVFGAYCAFYFILLHDKWKNHIVFTLCSLGAAYTHYYAMMAVAIMYIAIAIYGITGRINKKKVISTYVITFLGYLPWLNILIKTLARTKESFWMKDFLSFVQGCLYYYQSEQIVYEIIMFVITILIVGIIYIREFKGKNKKEDYINRDIISIWMIWGIIVSIGLLGICEFISYFIRPAFTERYLFPVVYVFWLTLSIGLTKINRGKIVSLIIIIVTMLVCVPNYLVTLKHQFVNGRNCDRTVEYMQDNINDGDIILTNTIHYAWTILSCYLPANTNIMATNEYSEFEDDKDYWLVWSGDLNDAEIEWINSNGYVAKEELCGGCLGNISAHIYKLEIK